MYQKNMILNKFKFDANNLIWQVHSNNLCAQLSKSIFAIRRIKTVINQEAAKAAYYALFHSKMIYALLIWGHTSHMQKVFILQKKAIRQIEGVCQDAHCTPLFKKHQILTLPSIYVYMQLTHVKKTIVHYPTRSILHGLNLRNNNHLHIPLHRLNTTRPSRLGLTLYNKLPDEWKVLSLNCFKKTVKKYLLMKCLYTINVDQF